MSEPRANRTPKGDGSTQTPKMYMMKMLKKPGNEAMAKSIYKTMLINGVEYCREHLLRRCHICEMDHSSTRDEVEYERLEMGLRGGGDSRVDQFCDKWESKAEEKDLLMALQDDLARIPPDFIASMGEDPRLFHENMNKHLSEDEQILVNEAFFIELKDLKAKGAGECCYWACENPSSEKLFVCSGCKFHKYCCREHQALDWKWEHRAECTANVPKFGLEEMEADM